MRPRTNAQERIEERAGPEERTTTEPVASKSGQCSSAHYRSFLQANIPVPAVVVAGILCCFFGALVLQLAISRATSSVYASCVRRYGGGLSLVYEQRYEFH